MDENDVNYHSVHWDTGAPPINPLQEEEEVDKREQTLVEAAQAAFASHNTTGLESFNLLSESKLNIEVCNPEKHGEGIKDSYTSYEIITTTMLETYKSPNMKVRRRFSDFVWLQNQLRIEYPASILPPLPEKNRMGYFDRFDQDFVQKRMLGLKRFLMRVAKHPLLQQSEALKSFLEKEFLASGDRKDSKAETWSDAFMNAFSKIKKPEEKFIQLNFSVVKLENHVRNIDRSQACVVKHLQGISDDFSDFVPSFSNIAHLEKNLFDSCTKLAGVIETVCGETNNFLSSFDRQCLSVLREYAVYCKNAKFTLKARDQRQIDSEDLNEYLKNHIEERDKIIRTGDPNAASNALTHFFQKKMDEFKGVDPDRARQLKLNKLEARITELQKAVETSTQVSEAFNKQVDNEFSLFHEMKKHDLVLFLREYCRLQLEYSRKAKSHWESLQFE